MAHLFFEHFLLLLGVFILGLILGLLAKWIAWRRFSASRNAIEVMPDVEGPDIEMHQEEGEESDELDLETSAFGLETPRGGVADELTMISGIGPKISELLNELGVFHFDQIAGWKEAEITGVDEILNFKGRINRENWVAQAGLLAAGEFNEHQRLFKK